MSRHSQKIVERDYFKATTNITTFLTISKKIARCVGGPDLSNDVRCWREITWGKKTDRKSIGTKYFYIVNYCPYIFEIDGIAHLGKNLTQVCKLLPI